MQSVWFLFWWCPLFSDCFHKLFLSGNPSENSQAGWYPRLSVWREMRLSHGKLSLRYSSVLFKVVVWNEVAPQLSNRTLEYLRHNFPWDRLISRQTDNLGHPIPKISTAWLFSERVTERQSLWKQSTDKRGHHQKRNQTDSTRNAQ